MSVPPGASYQASNTYIKLKRHLLNLEQPVRVQFKREWEAGSPLYDWYHRRSSRLIKTIQLRKEKDAPFFHEYVVFELDGSGGFFRIDRRQLPDETTPLDCIYKQGVEAFDTIEEVTSLEDSPYSASDCLVEIKVDPRGGFNIGLELVLKSLWAIQQNGSSRVYTLQRYNCYFVSQTIILLAARGAFGFEESEEDGDEDQDEVEDQEESRGLKRPYVGVSGINWEIGCSRATDISHFSELELEITECRAQVLPHILRYLFQRFKTCDQGFHCMCITHLDSCDFCRGLRTPFQTSSTTAMTFNASGRVLGLRRPHCVGKNNTILQIQHPETGESETQGDLPKDRDFEPARAILSHFEKMIVEFWRNRFSNTLKTINESAPDIFNSAYNVGVYQSEGELKRFIFKMVEGNSPFDDSSRALWSTCYRKALDKLASDLSPMVQRTLECHTWEPSLTPEVSSEHVANPRRTKNWIECMAIIFDSETERIERAVNAEVVALLLLDNHWRSGPFGIPTIHLSSVELYRTQVDMEWRIRNDTSKWVPSDVAGSSSWWKKTGPGRYAITLPELEAYLDELVKIHCARVEQYRLWLKCTRKEVLSDIVRTRESIWEMVKHGLEQTIWGLRINPTEFSLPSISNWQAPSLVDSVESF